MFLEPATILKRLGLSKEMSAVDLGSGSGSWVLPLARILEDGQVTAVDVLEEPLSALQSRARLEGLANIKTLVADAENEIRQLASEAFDLVLATNLLFQVEDKKTVFKLAFRVLKPGGKLLVVDWRKEAILGPKTGRVSEFEAEDIAEETGFQKEKEVEAGEYHYGLVFIK
ncbi:MAG: class I SAM-dependent methyltransferase [Patescibacteria group bacterium]|nr:class I SAM-dependent methyltransferase [Patescibacteria group bacterium]